MLPLEMIGGLVAFIISNVVGCKIELKFINVQKQFQNLNNKKSITVDVNAFDINGNAYTLDVQNDISQAQ